MADGFEETQGPAVEAIKPLDTALMDYSHLLPRINDFALVHAPLNPRIVRSTQEIAPSTPLVWTTSLASQTQLSETKQRYSTP